MEILFSFFLQNKLHKNKITYMLTLYNFLCFLILLLKFYPLQYEYIFQENIIIFILIKQMLQSDTSVSK